MTFDPAFHLKFVGWAIKRLEETKTRRNDESSTQPKNASNALKKVSSIILLNIYDFSKKMCNTNQQFPVDYRGTARKIFRRIIYDFKTFLGVKAEPRKLTKNQLKRDHKPKRAQQVTKTRQNLFPKQKKN